MISGFKQREIFHELRKAQQAIDLYIYWQRQGDYFLECVARAATVTTAMPKFSHQKAACVKANN